MKVSVVLPVYRNLGQLPELHRRLTSALAPLDSRYELVFVEDAGGDGSREWLLECGRRDQHTVVVPMPCNAGQHRAVLAGLRRATGEVVVVMDADLQDAPEAIPGLVNALPPGNAVAFARRVARSQGRSRHVTGLVFKRLLRIVAGSRVPAGTGMFFAASRSAVDAVVARSAGAAYVPLLFDEAGATMAAVPVLKEMRAGASGYTWRRRLRLAWVATRHAVAWRLARRPRARPPRGGR
jgi:polyisoprenyl-phosphate glycosyltransferase